MSTTQSTRLSDAYISPVSVVVAVLTFVKTAAAAVVDGDDDASQFDVTACHPEHLLLVYMGIPCSTTMFVFHLLSSSLLPK